MDADSPGDYFKAGAYTQANCDKSDPCSDDNYGEVQIYGLTVTHSDGARAAAVKDDCTAPDDAKLRDQDPDDEQLPWQRKDKEEVVVTFETKNLTPEFLDDAKQGVESWDRSPCVRPVLVDTCAPDTNCVTMGLEDADDDDDDGNFDAVEKDGFTTGGHITYYTNPLSDEGPTATLNVVKHEMGHAIGLRHRATEGVLMYADTNDTTEPDDIDYANLLVLYGKQ